MPGPPIEKLRDCVSVSASARASLNEKGERFCFKEILSLCGPRCVVGLRVGVRGGVVLKAAKRLIHQDIRLAVRSEDGPLARSKKFLMHWEGLFGRKSFGILTALVRYPT